MFESIYNLITKRKRVVFSYDDHSLHWILFSPGGGTILDSGSFDAQDFSRLALVKGVKERLGVLVSGAPEILFSVNSGSCEYFFHTFARNLSRDEIVSQLDDELGKKIGATYKDRSLSFIVHKGEAISVYGALFPKTLSRYIHRFIEEVFGSVEYRVVPGNLSYRVFEKSHDLPAMVLDVDEKSTSFVVMTPLGQKVSKVITYGYGKMIEALAKEKGIEYAEARTIAFKAGFPGKASPEQKELLGESRILFGEFQGFLKRLRKVVDFSLIAYPDDRPTKIVTVGVLSTLPNFDFQLSQMFKKPVSELTLSSGKSAEMGSGYNGIQWLSAAYSGGLLGSLVYLKKFETEKIVPVSTISLVKPVGYGLLLITLGWWAWLLYSQMNSLKELSKMKALESQFVERVVNFKRDGVRLNLVKRKINTLKNRRTRISHLGGGLIFLASSLRPGIQMKRVQFRDVSKDKPLEGDISFRKFTLLGSTQDGNFTLFGQADSQKSLEAFIDALQSKEGFHSITIVNADYAHPEKISFQIKGKYLKNEES